MKLLLLLLVACAAPSTPPPPRNVATRTTPTIAVAVVMNGWEMWIGNDKEVPDLSESDPSRYPGILIQLRAALDKHRLDRAGAPGSLGTVITFADRPLIRVPMGPLTALTGSSLGTQQDYFGATGVELVMGIRLGLAELAKVQANRRVLIVICDGNDTNNEAARAQLQDLKAQAAEAGIETFGIVYKAMLSGEENVLPLMIPDTAVITASKIDATIGAIRARL